MSTLRNIAIVSPNRDKYSETFIHDHVKLFPARVHFLFDGHLPLQFSTDKGLTAKKISDFNRGFFTRLLSKRIQDPQQALEIYLKKNRIDALFCEYGPSGVEMLTPAKKLDIPIIVHFHGYDAYRNDVLGTYGKRYNELFNQASAIIAVSAHMLGQLQQLGCPPEKLHWIPYGVNTSLFNVKSGVHKDITFVACGRFVEKKAPNLTIRAFAKVLPQLPGAKLVMIGDGELLGLCEILTAKLGLKHAVEFKGVLSQKEIAAIFRRSLVFVQHSITTKQNDSEGTPLAILESSACGLPVVSTLHAGIRDVVKQGETGFLVEEKNIDDMADKMLLLARDPGLAEQMGLSAAKHVSTRYDQTTYIQKLWQVILSTMPV